MPEAGTVVKRIELTAVDQASGPIRAVGQSAGAVASQIEAAAARSNSAIGQMDSRISGSAGSIGTSLGSIGGVLERTVSQVEGAAQRITTTLGEIDAKAGGMATPFQTADSQIATATASMGSSVERVGTTTGTQTARMTTAFETAGTKIASSLEDTEAKLRAYAQAVADEGARGAESWMTSSGKVVQAERDVRAAFGDTTTKVGMSVTEMNDAAISQAEAWQSAKDKMVTDQAEIQAAMERTASVASETATKVDTSAGRESAGASRTGGGTKEASRGLMTTGLGLLASVAYPLYAAGQFGSESQAIAGNTGMSPQMQSQMDTFVKKLTAAGSISSKEIFDSFLHAVSIFPHATKSQLQAIIQDSWLSAIGSHGSMSAITDALARALHNWNIGASGALHAVDVLKGIAARGDLTTQDLAENMGRSSVGAASLNVSMGQFGGLYDVLTKQFGAARTDAILAGIEQHLRSQTPAAQKEIKALGLSSELNATGVEKFGIFKVLSDFIDKLSGMTATQAGNALQMIMPGRTGGQGILALMQHGHLGEAEKITTELGGVLGPGGPAAGVGGVVGGQTEASAKRAEKTIDDQFKTMLNKAKVFSIDIGNALIPAATSVIHAVEPMMSTFGAFVKDHGGVVKAALEIGAGLVAIAVGMKAIAVAQAILALNPVLLVVLALAGAFVLAYQNVQPFRQAVDSLAKNVLPVLKSALSDVQSILGKVGDFLGSFARDFKAAFEKSPEYAAALHSVENGLKGIWNALQDALRGLGLFSSGTKSSRNDAQTLATILNDVLRVVVVALGTQFSVLAQMVVAAIHIVSNVIRTVADLIRNTFKVIGDEVTLLSDLFHGHWGKIAADTQKLVKDVVGLWSQLGKDILRLVGQLWSDLQGIVSTIVQGIIQFFTTLYQELVGHSIIPDLIHAIVTWFTNLPGMLAGALGDLLTTVLSAFKDLASSIATWATNLGHKFLGWAGGWADKIAAGITAGAGKIKDALTSAVQGAVNAAGNILGQIGNAVNGKPVAASGGGTRFGPSLFGMPAAAESAGPAARSGIPNPYEHTDIMEPAGTPFYLPGGKNATYKLISLYRAAWGLTEVWRTPNGGEIDFMHMASLPKTMFAGETEHGGYFAGTTGGRPGIDVPNPAYSTGAHLHVGADQAAYDYIRAVTGGKGFAPGPLMGAYGTGGSATGVGITYALASQSRTGGQFVSTPGAAPAAFQKEGEQAIPALYKAITALPLDLQKTFLPALQKIAGEWSKDQLDYQNKTAVENTRHREAIKAIETADEEARRHLLADAGIKDSAAKEKFLANETAILSKHSAAFKDGTTTEEKTLTRHGQVVHEEITRHVHALNDHAARITTTLTENGKVISTSSRIETKALADHSAAIDRISKAFGITHAQAAKLLDESLKHMSAQEAARILKEDELHQKHIQGLKTVLEGHVNGIHGELTALQKSIAAAQAPDKRWDALVKDVKDTLSKDTKSMAYLAVAGSPITTTKPVYTQEEVATGRNQAGVQTKWESVQTGVITTVQSVADQMEKWAKDAAVSVLKQEALNTVLAASTSLVDLFGGKLADFATQLGTVRSLWTEQILSDAVQGKAVNQTYLDNIAQVDQGLKDAQTAQVGLTAIIAVNEHSFSGMKAAADSLYQDTLPKWEDAMVASGSAQNQYTSGLVQSAQAQKELGVAQDAENVIVGQLTGNLGLLDSGLKAFASKAVDAVTLWATNLGRIGGDAANSGLSIVKLGQDSTQAADSLGTLPDIISGLTTATSAIEAAAETQFARTGSIDPATLSAYGNAQGQVTTATYDQYGAQLLLYRSTGDLNNYYQVLGKEIGSLQQTTIPELTAKYGANSTQVAAATATLKTLQTEYTGLGDELKIMGGDTSLTSDQVAAAGKAFAVFTGTGLDPAILAAQQFGAIITAGLNPQQQFNDNTATGATNVQTLGTNALTAASDLLTLDTSIASVVGAFAAAVVAIKAAASGAGSSGSSTSAAGVSLSGSPHQNTFGTADLTDTSGLAGIGGSVTIPAGYAWATYNGQQVLEPIGSSQPPNGTITVNGQQVPIYTPPTTAGTLNLGTNPNPAPAATTTTTATTTTAPTGQTVSLGGGSSGYLYNGTVYQPGSQLVINGTQYTVQTNGTLGAYNNATQAASNLGNAATTSVNGTGYTGPTIGIASPVTTTTPVSTAVAFSSGMPSGSGSAVPNPTGGQYYPGTTMRQWNALGATAAQANTTLRAYNLVPASFWAMDYAGQYAALQSVGILGSTTLQHTMDAGTWRGPGNPITGGFAAGSGSGTGSSSGTGTSATPPASWDPASSTTLPGGLTGIARSLMTALSGMGSTGTTMYPGGNKSGLLPLGTSTTSFLTPAQKTALWQDISTHNVADFQAIMQTAWQSHFGSVDWSSLFGGKLGLSTAPKDTSGTAEVKSLLQSILLTLKQELGGQIKLTADRMEQLIKQGEDILHHPMTYTAGQRDETTFDTLTRLRPA